MRLSPWLAAHAYQVAPRDDRESIGSGGITEDTVDAQSAWPLLLDGHAYARRAEKFRSLESPLAQHAACRRRQRCARAPTRPRPRGRRIRVREMLVLRRPAGSEDCERRTSHRVAWTESWRVACRAPYAARQEAVARRKIPRKFQERKTTYPCGLRRSRSKGFVSSCGRRGKLSIAGEPASGKKELHRGVVSIDA